MRRHPIWLVLVAAVLVLAAIIYFNHEFLFRAAIVYRAYHAHFHSTTAYCG